MTGAPADLSVYANQFNELQVEERETIIDLNAIHPISELRSDSQNATDTSSEHRLSTTANTDDTAYLQTDERGEYTAGYQVQAGTGMRIPSNPTGDSTIRWGYYEVDSNGDPTDGFYFGVDSTGIFVAKARAGDIKRVYQNDQGNGGWNGDPLDGSGKSDVTLDLSDGSVFQIEFVYYGYGSIEMQVLVGESDTKRGHTSTVVNVHTFNPTGETSIENTNLPLREEIASGGTTNDSLDAFVGGRQFSVIGERTENARRTGHYYDEQAGVDDTKWYHLVSFKLKDGTDIGSINFTKVLCEVDGFEIDTDSTAYRWQIRRGTQPSGPVWENPSSAEDNQDETALKADTTSADIQDGSGNLTGVMVDGGTLSSGQKNNNDTTGVGATGTIANEQIVSLVVKAVPGGSGTVSEIYFRALERW